MSFHGMSKAKSSSRREVKEEKFAHIPGIPTIIIDMEGSYQENSFAFPISESL